MLEHPAPQGVYYAPHILEDSAPQGVGMISLRKNVQSGLRHAVGGDHEMVLRPLHGSPGLRRTVHVIMTRTLPPADESTVKTYPGHRKLLIRVVERSTVMACAAQAGAAGHRKLAVEGHVSATGPETHCTQWADGMWADGILAPHDHNGLLSLTILGHSTGMDGSHEASASALGHDHNGLLSLTILGHSTRVHEAPAPDEQDK